MDEIKIRRASLEDADGIAEILLESYNMNTIKEAKDAFLNESKMFNFIVAEKGENIIGIASWLMHGLPKHGLCEINRIAVLSNIRGRGIGKLLFSGAVKDSEQFYKENNSRLRKIFLFTHETNKKAQKFYASIGLEQEARLKDHYYDNVNELVFSKFLRRD